MAAPAVAVEELAPPTMAGQQHFLAHLLRNRNFVLGSVIFLAIVGTAFVGSLRIDDAERRIEMLVKDEAGATTTRPFAWQAEDEA